MSKETPPPDTAQDTTDQPLVDGTTARLILPAEEFAFAPVFERAPDAHIEIESTASCLDEYVLVTISANDSDRDVIESALRTDSTLREVRCVAERADGWTYRLQWGGRARCLVQQFVAENTTLLAAQARESQWTLRVLTPDRHTLSRMYETITDLGYSVDCRRITSYDGGDTAPAKLTDAQQEALTAAYEAGYYHIPQDTTADELAERLGISHQALSERLHRAYERLVEDELTLNSSH